MPNITAEPILSGACPSAGITVSGLAAGEQVVTVWRVTGSERVAVRGARAIPVIDSLYVQDFEAPLARTVIYELEVLSGVDAGVQGVTAETVITADSGYIHDPLDPSSAVPVHGSRRPGGEAALRPRSFAALSYAASGSTQSVLGSNRPVVIASPRMALSSAFMEMVTRAEVENTRMRNLIQQSAVLVFRPLPSWGGGLPGSATYFLPDVTEKPLRALGAQTSWEMTGDVVRSSSARILVALWTYQDVAEIFATYDQKQAAAGSGNYLSDQKNPTNTNA